MHALIDTKAGSRPFRVPLGLGFGVLLAVALVLLWGEHRVHILGALPYGLLLLCIVFHRLLHGGHDDHQDGAGGRAGVRHGTGGL